MPSRWRSLVCADWATQSDGTANSTPTRTRRIFCDTRDKPLIIDTPGMQQILADRTAKRGGENDNWRVPLPDSKIDDLYKGPLGEFVARRAALAKTLAGDEAKRVKGLQKPTVVPWAVNQVYGHARPVYDRLAASGENLRAAQIAALKGKTSDVRHATEAHRKAVRDAVAEALRLASGGGAHPGADELTKTLEAVSLARDLPEQ